MVTNDLTHVFGGHVFLVDVDEAWGRWVGGWLSWMYVCELLLYADG